ncbi:artemin-like [Mastomys coucha]|uniref:artemin-like n=1 Tax=Mastomys coucha TaxID=35658 RepID=UPI0012618E31|nr:artemin-like [Mastomys coucha]
MRAAPARAVPRGPESARPADVSGRLAERCAGPGALARCALLASPSLPARPPARRARVPCPPCPPLLALPAGRGSLALSPSPGRSAERCEFWAPATPPPARDLHPQPPPPARPSAQPCPARGGRRRRRGRTDGRGAAMHMH